MHITAEPGGRLYAEGTRELPITFTADGGFDAHIDHLSTYASPRSGFGVQWGLLVAASGKRLLQMAWRWYSENGGMRAFAYTHAPGFVAGRAFILVKIRSQRLGWHYSG